MPNIRKANEDDSGDIFDWLNDDFTRQMSHNSDFVDWNGHSGWFEASLDNKNRLIVMCEDESTNKKLAMVRFDVEDDRALISINLSPKMRGKRKAKGCLSDAISFFQKYFSEIRFIDAEIKSINAPSKKLFKGVGFVFVKENADVLYYEYTL
jgi:RimJ/RimL family protein N-acetyltransferase